MITAWSASDIISGADLLLFLQACGLGSNEPMSDEPAMCL